jgi:selenoprotein W-related protein
MAERIFEEFGTDYRVELVPGSGGVFEVEVDGRLVFSKKETGRHADYDTDVAPHLRAG